MVFTKNDRKFGDDANWSRNGHETDKVEWFFRYCYRGIAPLPSPHKKTELEKHSKELKSIKKGYEYT